MAGEFSIASFNLHNFNFDVRGGGSGVDPKFKEKKAKADRICEIIRTDAYDIIALQEVQTPETVVSLIGLLNDGNPNGRYAFVHCHDFYETISNGRFKSPGREKRGELAFIYDSETVVRDDVQYCLKPGLEYTIKGVVMDKNTQGKLIINGEPVEQEITIEPEEACGEVKMYYPINTTDLAGSELVIFESLYLDEELILEHKDFNNEHESFSVAPIPIPVPNTGSVSEESKGKTNFSSPWIIGAIVIIAPIGIYFTNRFYHKKRFLSK